MSESTSTINRRNFLKLSGFTGTGLMIGLSLKANGESVIEKITQSYLEKQKALQELTGAGSRYDLSPFVVIEPTGQITLMNPRPEIGQGVYQSVPSLIAEELEVPLEGVTIQQTGGQKKYGNGQFAGGSASVRTSYMQMRQIGAAAKEMLVMAAAQQWGVPVSECYADNAKIMHRPSGKTLGYGDVAAAAAKLEVPKNPTLKDPKNFKILGKRYPRPDVPLKSTGKAMFGIDVKVPGMVYASIERCPVFGGKLVRYDDTAAKKVKGVIGVETCERDINGHHSVGVAVLAENYWAALQGRKALKVTWDYDGNESFNSKDFAESLRQSAKEEGAIDHQSGDFDKAFAEAPVKLEAFYETPVVSHSPIEPMNCVCNWYDGNKIEIWASTQVPGRIMDQFTKKYNIPEENITIHVLFSGGGFGRRLYPDYVEEAIELSKKIGKPVKSLWTREDDTKMGPFRPMTFSAFKGALDANGNPLAFQHKVIAPTLDGNKNYDKTKSNGTMTEGISEQKYEIPNIKNLYVFHYMPVPLAAWRAVTSTTLAFSHESFIDEMAVAAKKDPIAFRLDMLTKDTDTKTLMQKLKEVSKWETPLPTGWGRGVAQWEFFAGLAGYVVEVSKKGNGIQIEKAYAVIDLGTVVNPDTVEAQVQGAAVMALTAAIKNGITFNNGQTVQSNFNNNPLVRINEMPPVEVHIIANGGPKIKGVGEPGLPPFAPALCNAIYAATGKRIRKLPFDINHIV
ncbi:xanthine dehydrogenase family protein molybdopterin-binding subunit [Hydrotalea sp.]|uniref:xanthine dehydrogenase family protein molybdopterin-binding subunit n=2 Tax=Hydrotalea sp. TaxID=2881279 RepID=UPI002583965E|nr:xanthine dehydrogenase family protein molybdopterin-binding subunit [Hydrotalea sp.]